MRKSNTIKLPQPRRASEAWRNATDPVFRKGLAVSKCNGGSEDHACDHSDAERHTGCCRRHAVVLPGYGSEEYPLPTTDELMAQFIAYFNELAREFQENGTEAIKPEDLLRALNARPSNVAQWQRRQKVLERARAKATAATGTTGAAQAVSMSPNKQLIADIDGVSTSATGGTALRMGAGTLAAIMHDGRFKAVIARQFDQYKGACNWALNNLPKKFHAPAASARDHFQKLEDIYSEALPRGIMFLAAQYPNSDEMELLDAAVSVLNEQLMEILNVLAIWSDSFAHQMYGFYPQLGLVHFTVEQANHLFHNGDLLSDAEGSVKNRAFHLNDCFMARFSEQGPATIPGGRGPVGAHAIEVPFDEADLIVLYLLLYLHEFRHDFYFDVEGLEEDEMEAVLEAVQKAHAEGRFKFTSEFITLGTQKVKTIDLVTQIFAQTLSETDADIAGGVALGGEAFMYSMLATFSAFNLRGSDPFSANRMLRHGSYFAIGEKGELAFEPHMPDYMRAYVGAAALDLIGFNDEADECRKLADSAAGVPTPRHILWRNVDSRSRFKFDIKVPIEDLKQVAPVVVDAILNAKLSALGNKSNGELVNWDRKDQAQADALVRNLLAGSGEVPTDMGHFFAPHVAAAAVKAVWTLWKAGSLPPKTAAYFVEENARTMMYEVRARFEAAQEAKELRDAARAEAEEEAAAPAPKPAPRKRAPRRPKAQ